MSNPRISKQKVREACASVRNLAGMARHALESRALIQAQECAHAIAGAGLIVGPLGLDKLNAEISTALACLNPRLEDLGAEFMIIQIPRPQMGPKKEKGDSDSEVQTGTD